MLGPDGKKLWSWQAPADVSFLERGPEASVYAAYSDTLTKLDAKGKYLWSATAYERIYSLLVLADGKAVAGSGYGALAFDTGGKKVWESDPQNAVYPIYDCAT